MNKLKPLIAPELSFFQGYLNAASEMFIRGQLDSTLVAVGFEILDSSITAEEVIAAAYPGGFNPIEYVREESLEQLQSEIESFLTIARGFWKNAYVGSLIEANLRKRYWNFLAQCFDYRNAQIFAIGNDVPWVNIGPGFAYVLFDKDKTRCLVLVGNTTD